MYTPPTIVTLSGPSGCGKTTIAGEIIRTHPRARLIPSVTTRVKRPSDLPGEYEYVDYSQFEAYLHAGGFLWHTQPHNGPRYGTLAESVREAYRPDASHSIMILVPDVVPLLHDFVWKECGKSVTVLSIFILQPREEILIERLRARGMDEGRIRERLAAEADWHPYALNQQQFRFVMGGDSLLELPRVISEVMNDIDYQSPA